MPRRWFGVALVGIGAAAVTAVALLAPTNPVLDPSSPPLSPADDSVVSFRLRLGLTDTEPRRWDGELEVSGGEVVNLRLWRPRPGDRIEGTHRWQAVSRQGVNFQKRPWEAEEPVGPQPYILATGIIADMRGSAGTRVRVRTAQGNFELRPFELAPGSPQSYLGGAVVADRVPTAQMVSTRERQNDFATLVAGPDGEVWVAWVAYADWKNQVMARRWTGSTWEDPLKVSDTHDDIFLVKAARDAKGRIWFVWSAQVDGNWDLYARRREGSSWSAVERLTTSPQPDIFPALALDARGNLWLAWQGFRDGASDIFARYHDGAAWSAEEKLSESPANDWEPAVASDNLGRLWVAWDTYDQGNYDVVLRRREAGRWSELMPVAATPKFEAHVSLACDGQNRLWAAWNEGGTQWGKDTGFLLNRQGTRLYQGRWIAVAVFDGGWKEPVAGLEASLPPELRGYNDMPIVAGDGKGRVWLLFRHRLPRILDTPSDTPMHRAAWEIFATTLDGDRWLEPITVPFSQGRLDMRTGFASDGAGRLYAAWPMDNRDYAEFLFVQADVYVGRIPPPRDPPREPRLRPRKPEEIPTFPLHPKESEDLARIRSYEIRSGGKTYRIYRGDTHRHTEFSMDGHNDGSLIDTYRYALDAASLDFLMVSDHNHLAGPDVEYINWLLQQMADVLLIRGRFVPLFGYERSVPYPNGHRNVVFARRGIPTLPIPPEEMKAATGAQALYDYLRKYDGIAISHTSASDMGTDWRDNDPEREPLVEIYQGYRVSAEHEGAPRAAWGGKLTGAPGGYRPAGYVWSARARGYKLGVQASSDHLSTHISYACTIAEEFTRQGLLAAMKKRHSYGATDNIVLDYRLRTRDGAEYLQGDILRTGAGFTLWIKAVGTAPIRQIDIIKNNTFVHTSHPLRQEVELTFADARADEQIDNYYYVRLIQVDDQMAWSSPIWVTVK